MSHTLPNLGPEPGPEPRDLAAIPEARDTTIPRLGLVCVLLANPEPWDPTFPSLGIHPGPLPSLGTIPSLGPGYPPGPGPGPSPEG